MSTRPGAAMMVDLAACRNDPGLEAELKVGAGQVSDLAQVANEHDRGSEPYGARTDWLL